MEYMTPEFDIVLFEVNDVICASTKDGAREIEDANTETM